MKHLIKKILKEETEDFDKSVFNFLVRRAKIYDRELGHEDFKVREVTFNIENEFYFLNSFLSKKDMTWKVLNMLQDENVINLGEYNPNVLNTDRQKVVRAIRKFINSVF